MKRAESEGRIERGKEHAENGEKVFATAWLMLF